MCCRQCFRSNAKEIGFIKVNSLFLVSPCPLVVHIALVLNNLSHSEYLCVLCDSTDEFCYLVGGLSKLGRWSLLDWYFLNLK
ncbi:hypothetical protein LINPERPRIM_LOCUS10983 [Linum perenne]